MQAKINSAHESRKFLDMFGDKAPAVVSDGDRTLWCENVAEHGMGVPLIIKMLRQGRIPVAIESIKGYFEIKRAVKSNPSLGSDPVEGLQMFYSKLKRAGIGTKDEMAELAFRYILHHQVLSTSVILKGFNTRFLATCNGSSVAEAANKVFTFRSMVCNTDVFYLDQSKSGQKPYKIDTIDIKIKDGEDKARYVYDMLNNQGIRLKDCVYMGDGPNDIPSMMIAGFPVASPFATEEVRAVAHHILTDISIVAFPHA
jgi:hydroxymethylpyrimidine pyrophosphatase-like HAD family hydrolase